MPFDAEIPDRITKSIVLNAPIERVWRAISDAHAFGTWFGITFEGPFIAGQTIRGHITPTRVDPEVAKLQEPHAGTPFEWRVEQIMAPNRISFRWHPYAVERERDYTSEPTTLIEFELTAVAQGTRLVITESGFSQIPLERRAEAFTSNEGGWEHQTKLLAKYLSAYATR